MNIKPQENLLLVSGYEIGLLRFGMAGCGQPFVEHTIFSEEIEKAIEAYGPELDSWDFNEVVAVPNDELHIACAAISFREAKDEAGHNYGNGWAHPLSATHARNARKVEICSEALAVLAEVSDGEQGLEEIVQNARRH